MFQAHQHRKEVNQNKEVHIPVAPKPKRRRRRIIESHKSGSEESYEPDFNQYKMVGLPVDMSRVTIGSWSLEENKIYLDFLKSYKKDFQDQVSRRRSTVFNRLSKALRKRTPDQCRSHHQKLQNRFKNNIDLIMDFVRSKIEKQIQEGGEDKQTKGLGMLRPTATGTLDDDSEGLIIDMMELTVW